MADVYHRVPTGRSNQNLLTAFKQTDSKQVWGGLSTYGNLYPTVRAFFGPLPDGWDGVEFETDVAPSKGCSTPREAFWKLGVGTPGVVLAADGSSAAIPVRLRKVRYTSSTSLGAGVDWVL
jgi:hypothetical protein